MTRDNILKVIETCNEIINEDKEKTYKLMGEIDSSYVSNLELKNCGMRNLRDRLEKRLETKL